MCEFGQHTMKVIEFVNKGNSFIRDLLNKNKENAAAFEWLSPLKQSGEGQAKDCKSPVLPA